MLACHDVRCAAHRNDALQTIVVWQPDLVLADWFDSDGPKLIEELHAVFAGPSFRHTTPPPVVLVTEASSVEALQRYLERALHLGATDVLPMPAVASSVRQTVGELLNGTRRVHAALELIISVESDDVRIVDVMDEPIARVAQMAGGMRVLDEIIERHACRRNPGTQRRLADALTAWGTLDETGRLADACAITLTVDTERAAKDPVDAVLLDLAHTIISVDRARHATP